MKPLHERLVARHPLPPKVARALRSSRDLGKLAAAYAERGAYHGAKGPWWRVFRALERARGHDLRASVAGLDPAARRWFALWSFARGRVREGMRIYRAYLAQPGDIGPFDRENALYLRHVAAKGDPARVVREADALVAKTTQSAEVEEVVLDALVALGDHAALRARYPEPDASTVHDGGAWARYAIARQRSGDRDGATRALEMCAKLGVRRRRDDTALETKLREAFALDDAAWSALRAPWDYPTFDTAARWRANRGARVTPTASSPHAFGGDAFAMPPCPGCGHTMHAFFVIDVSAVADLRARIPSFPALPLVGCIDCAAWLLRRDFRIDHAARRVELVGVFAAAKALASFGNARTTLPRLRRQPIALEPIAEAEEPGSDRTQIGGEPDWVQDFERAFCPQCHDEMVFVAALGSTWRSGLEPEITINNGSGYQYHFACDRCAVLSVFGQNT